MRYQCPFCNKPFLKWSQCESHVMTDCTLACRPRTVEGEATMRNLKKASEVCQHGPPGNVWPRPPPRQKQQPPPPPPPPPQQQQQYAQWEQHAQWAPHQ